MIKTRIAGTAALVTFGLAALGGAVLTVAAPANAAPAASGTTSDTTSTGPTSKVGSTPTSGVNSTGGAKTSSASDLSAQPEARLQINPWMNASFSNALAMSLFDLSWSMSDAKLADAQKKIAIDQNTFALGMENASAAKALKSQEAAKELARASGTS